jgi:GNAT superfamily N-acetyltransferase
VAADVQLAGAIATERLLLEWSEAPWDTAIYRQPVLQVTRLELRGDATAADAAPFLQARDACGSTLVSCRLPAERLRESMFLEDLGFRFVEMLYAPEIDLQGLAAPAQPLQLARAEAADLQAVREIAGSAFRNERFHVDPRLPMHLADLRYQNWACSALEHPRQRLEVLRDGGEIVSFFVTEMLADGTCYWHLNAVAPGAQGKGYGRRAWQTMLAAAAGEGAARVRTSIVARNHRVLNLYVSLRFRFLPPQMTFHWVRAGG